MKKLLKGIAYYESMEPMEMGSELPENLGEIYDFTQYSAIVGHKFALLLRAEGFSINDCEHVLINFTPALNEGTFELSERRLQRWQCFVNYGLKPESLAQTPPEERKMLLVASTEKVLRECFAEDDTEQKKIHEAARDIIMYGEKLEIAYLLKSDKNFDVTVSLNLLNNANCRIILTVQDKQGRLLQKREIALTKSYEEALDHVGTILVRKNRIVVKPKNNLHTKNVQPIEIILGEE